MADSCLRAAGSRLRASCSPSRLTPRHCLTYKQDVTTFYRLDPILTAFLAACGMCAALICSAPASAQTASKGDPKKGAARAEPCAACHGAPKTLPPAGMPSLFGQQPEYLVLQMFLIREQLRHVPQMAGLLKGVSDTELVDMAAYFASRQPTRENTKVDPKRYARGEALAKKMACGSCHLPDYSGQRQVPRLTGQRQDYLTIAMKAYRDNTRSGSDTSMNAILYQMPDSDIEALSHYLAHQK